MIGDMRQDMIRKAEERKTVRSSAIADRVEQFMDDTAATFEEATEEVEQLTMTAMDRLSIALNQALIEVLRPTRKRP